MSTQTEIIEISGLPPGTKKAIEELSRSKGKSAEEYLRMLVEAEILSEQTFSEILAPIRQSFRESGMSEQQLDALFEDLHMKSNGELQREFESWDAASDEDFLKLEHRMAEAE